MGIASCALVAAACISLVVLDSPAIGRPLPHDIDLKRQRSVGLPPPKLKLKFAVQRPAQAVPQSTALVERISLSARMKPPFALPALVVEARKYMGTNPTDRRRLWCATFMNLVLAKLGYHGTNSDAARSFAYYGRRISEPEVGAIAVLSRGKTGGHVGVVSGIDKDGNPVIISGNHNKRVGEAVYPRSRVIAYVMPTERRPVLAAAVAERGPVNRPSSEPMLDSPITELLAAIEAEQVRAENRKQRSAETSTRTARAPAQDMPPPARRRVVQQTAESVTQTVPASVPAARPLPGDPLSELFARLERVQPRRTGRIAAADNGRGVR